MPRSISELIMEYFMNHPNEDLSHGPVVDWVTEEYLRERGKPPRDPWRAIRKLHQEGKLIKVRKGVYRYDPDQTKEVQLQDFSSRIKQEIFERDNYRCIVYGRGRQDGVELVVDHIKPKDRGGTNDIENGQTLCTEHNLLKKNYSQTEAGKKYFIKIYERAVVSDDKTMIEFCDAIFDVYDTFEIDRHIMRPDRE